jgi:hypothetical protein
MISAFHEPGVAVEFAPFILGLCATPLALVAAIRSARRNGSASKLTKRLLTLVEGGASSEADREIRELLEDEGLYREERAYAAAALYVASLQTVLLDSRIDDDELDRIAWLERALQLNGNFVHEARQYVFREIYLETIADHDLTEDEEETLAHVRTRLAIPEATVSDELDILNDLRDMRTIRSGALPEVEANVKLQRGEVCHYAGEGRILRSKVLSRFQQEGQKYAVRGMEVDKEGDVYITSKRLLLVHSGKTSIKLDKLLDVEVDTDANLITLTKDGVQRPTYLTTPDAPRAAAILATAAGL